MTYASRCKSSPAQHVHTGEALVIPGAQRQLANHSFFVRAAVNGTVRTCRLHLDIQNRIIFVLHINIQAYPLAVNPYADAFIRFKIKNFLDVYVQDMFNELLAEFFVLHYFQKHKVIGKSHGIPVNLIKIFHFSPVFPTGTIPSVVLL